MGKTIIRGYKYKIYPTEEQACQIDRFIDITRYVYNWGIAKEQEIYEKYKRGGSKYQFYTFYELRSLFRNERNNNPNLYWLKDMPIETASLQLRNVFNGYKRFFNRQNENPPYFKSKKKCKKTFNTRYDRFNIENDCIKIEGIKDRISLGFESNFNINGYRDKKKIINPTITKDYLGNYYVSFSIEEEIIGLPVLNEEEGIGIDLGIRRTFTLSNGKIYNQPKEKLNILENKRRRQQRHVTRDINRRISESKYTKTKHEDIPKSKRSIKRENKLLKTYRKIHNIKNTFYHTITKKIVDMKPKYVCMETFSVKDIQKNKPYINDKLAQVSFYDITQKMKYKCEERNIPFIQVPREFASTQICNNCGNQKKMYGYHTYKCPVCGMIEDRDINAAINLKNYGLSHL